ncbi:MAG: hypothetical protein K0Q55_275 [Verrucomicrobia bacterium]|jgi:membrane-associated protease RseP (regulator of RpoE activity)|nr:hypothetical protein [Verrucomicrobiota bacterium]
MLQFTVMGFQVVVQPFFWLIMALFGGAISARTSDDWIQVVLFIFVAFVSILVHELGHALGAKKFGEHSTILLHGFGGATYIPRARFTRGQSIFVSAAGPFAGFLLAGITFIAFIFFRHTEYVGLRSIISISLWINVVWTVMNLLPIMPMDGGNILRELLGPRRERLACMIGGTLAVIVALWAIQAGAFYPAFLFGYFAWINFSNGSTEGGVMK